MITTNYDDEEIESPGVKFFIVFYMLCVHRA